MSTFAAMLRDNARRAPAATAIIYGDDVLSFAELDARSSRAAQAMLAAGVRAGDRVGVLSRNRPEYFEAIHACGKIGAVLVGLNWRLAAAEIAAIVRDARPSLILVGDSGEADLLTDEARATPSLGRIVRFGEDYEVWLGTARGEDPGHVGAPDDPAMVLYTSGTTGQPKGAVLTNRGLSFTRRLADAWGMDAASVNLVAMPLFHIGGCGYGSSTMLAGGATVLMRDVDPEAIVRAIARRRVTHAFFVPTVVRMLLAVPEVATADLSSLKLLMYGASPMDETLLKRTLSVFGGAGLMQAYGMTETSGTVVVLPPEDHGPEAARSGRLRACGRALPFAEARIVDPASGAEAKRGEVGEIWIRSDMNMAGYWKKPEATAEALVAGGWLRTGDAAWMDEAGYIFLHDRYKDMIISGGENIYPAEIENALLSHPGIAEAGVFGVRHEHWGETPRAVVVPKPGVSLVEGDVIDYAVARLARYKRPTSVVFAQTLPRNASGKLLKRELRRLYGDQPPAREPTRAGQPRSALEDGK